MYTQLQSGTPPPLILRVLSTLRSSLSRICEILTYVAIWALCSLIDSWRLSRTRVPALYVRTYVAIEYGAGAESIGTPWRTSCRSVERTALVRYGYARYTYVGQLGRRRPVLHRRRRHAGSL